MVATPYLVKLAGDSGHTLPQGVNAMVVNANSANQAKAMAAAAYAGDSNAAWLAATVTEIVARTDAWGGATLRLRLSKPEEDPIEVDVVGTATHTFQQFMTAVVAALNALDEIAGAAWDNSGRILKVAETTDGLGDYNLTLKLLGANGGDLTAAYLTSITDEGASGAAVTATFNNITLTQPSVKEVFKRLN